MGQFRVSGLTTPYIYCLSPFLEHLSKLLRCQQHQLHLTQYNDPLSHQTLKISLLPVVFNVLPFDNHFCSGMYIWDVIQIVVVTIHALVNRTVTARMFTLISTVEVEWWGGELTLEYCSTWICDYNPLQETSKPPALWLVSACMQLSLLPFPPVPRVLHYML